MKAPEKIFICDYGSEFGYEWHSESELEKCSNDIEYTRTDVFIEKAVNFLEMLGCGFTITDNITKSLYDNVQLIEDFKKYMEE